MKELWTKGLGGYWWPSRHLCGSLQESTQTNGQAWNGVRKGVSLVLEILVEASRTAQ